MTQREQGLSLLAKAQQDAYAFARLMDDMAVADAILGFHAQQAIDKSIKAVLATKGVIFPYTHDLLPLIDLLQGAKIDFPFEMGAALALVPYAVTFRYEEHDETPLNRSDCYRLISAVVEWAEKLV